MLKILKNHSTWTTAFAIFSMFFGAGNVVFPLLLGTIAKDKNFIANLGLLLSSIGGPLLGLYAGILFKGDFKAFFLRIGKIPGYFCIIFTSLLLGPFAVMPRCLVVAYAALEGFLFGTSLALFCIIAALILFFLSVKKNNLLSVLGYYLSPVLIVCLIIIIIFANSSGYTISTSPLTSAQALKYGLVTGYDTMDLIASIFFSVAIWKLLKVRLKFETKSYNPTYELKMIIASSLIAGALLALIYSGFSFASAHYSQTLQNVSDDKLLTTLAYQTLGDKFGSIANIAIALACLTTVISLAVTFTEIAQKNFRVNFLSYRSLMIIILLLTAAFANLGFRAINMMIHPIISLIYPSIIVLSICNIFHKLYGMKMVRLPFYLTLLLTISFKLFIKA